MQQYKIDINGAFPGTFLREHILQDLSGIDLVNLTNFEELEIWCAKCYFNVPLSLDRQTSAKVVQEISFSVFQIFPGSIISITVLHMVKVSS